MIDYQQSIQENPAFSASLNHSPCVNAIIDLRRQQFDFISSNTGAIFGNESSLFMEKGLDFCNEIIHPEDLKKTWKLIKNKWDFILDVPPANQAQFIFNYDYRIIKPDGKEVRILAQNSVLQSDSKGTITHVLGVYSDISHWKKSEQQIASIISTANESCFFFTSGDSGTYKPQVGLSKRELEIVKLVVEGYSSRLIDDKLFINVHTGSTHRQKIIEKRIQKIQQEW